MFYYETDGKLVNLSRVQDEYDSKKGDISKYRNKMLCPECRKAKLRFTHKQQKKMRIYQSYRVLRIVRGALTYILMPQKME